MVLIIGIARDVIVKLKTCERKSMAVKWEYEVGPLTINFRALVEPKGFLRIIMVVSAAALLLLDRARENVVC